MRVNLEVEPWEILASVRAVRGREHGPVIGERDMRTREVGYLLDGSRREVEHEEVGRGPDRDGARVRSRKSKRLPAAQGPGCVRVGERSHVR